MVQPASGSRDAADVPCCLVVAAFLLLASFLPTPAYQLYVVLDSYKSCLSASPFHSKPSRRFLNYLYGYPSIHLSIYIPTYIVCIYLLAYPSIRLSSYLSICPSMYLSIRLLPIYLPIYLSKLST